MGRFSTLVIVRALNAKVVSIEHLLHRLADRRLFLRSRRAAATRVPRVPNLAPSRGTTNPAPAHLMRQLTLLDLCKPFAST
jgi:hypothetical protein